MTTTGAGDVFRGVYEGSISGSHMEVDRRPYHKNCSCALHGGSRGGKCAHRKPSKISYPIRRSWSEGTSLALYAASSSSLNSSPSSSPAIDQLSKITPLPRTPSSSSFEYL